MPADPVIVEERLLVVADAFAALISDAAYLAGVPVLTERKGDINQMIAQALAKLGLSIVVVAPSAEVVQRKGQSLQLRVKIVAQVTELYLANQSATGLKKPALSATIAVMKAIDRKPNGLDATGTLHRDGLNEFQLQEEEAYRLTADPRYIVYQVTAHTTVDL